MVDLEQSNDVEGSGDAHDAWSFEVLIVWVWVRDLVLGVGWGGCQTVTGRWAWGRRCVGSVQWKVPKRQV